MRAGSGNSKVYKIYGQNLATTFNFNHFLMRTLDTSKIDVRFSIVSSPPFEDEWKNKVPSFVKTIKLKKGKKTGMVYQLNGCHVISLSEVADYYITCNHIYCQPRQIDDFALIESRLLTSIFSYWLELQECNNVLHASCVNINGKAVAFLASSRSGKSTLAAAFVSRGYPLITDDILRIKYSGDTFYASTGYPAMHMWLESAEYFLGKNVEKLSPVSSQTSKLLIPISSFSTAKFCIDDVELDRVYLPARSLEKADTQTTIETVSSSEGLFRLMSNCFAAESYSALGKQVDKLKNIAVMAEKVLVKHINYPDGFEYLPRVVETVLEDIGSKIIIS